MISILYIRKSKWFKKACLLTAVLILEPIYNSKIWALSGGPTSPEFAQFSGVGNGDFVDPFTGDVKYSVPLFDVGGYPVTLSYSGNISTEQDAGWVGLGWNLNVGAITRGLRGVPDDFNGEEVKVTRYEKPHRHFEFQFQGHKGDSIKEKSNNESDEITLLRINKNKSASKLTIDYPTIVYDNYRGLGWKYNIDFTRTGVKNGKLSQLDLKLSNSSMDGTSLTPGYQRSSKVFSKIMSFSPGMAVNSRTGISSLGLNKGVSVAKQVDAGLGYNIPFVAPSSFPEGNFDRIDRSQHYLFQLSKPKAIILNARKISIGVSLSTSHIRNNGEQQAHKAYGYFYMNPVINEQQGKDKDGNYIIDVDVENKGWDKFTRELPKASKQYDVFTITGSGVGGSVRAFDFNPTVCGPTPYRTISVNGFDAKLEIGKSAASTELGIDLGVQIEKEKYGMWNQNNMGQHNKLLSNFNTDTKFELKNDFEFTQADPTYMQMIVAGNPVRADMKGKSKFRIPKTNNGFIYKQTKGNGDILVKPLTDNNGDLLILGKSKKESRQQVVTFNKVSQAVKYGIHKTLPYYIWDGSGVPQVNNVDQKYEILQLTKTRTFSDAVQPGHIADFTVLQPDGSRYYYGFPLYNLSETHVSFSIDPDQSSTYKDQGLTNYTPGSDNKVKNNNGIDNFYEKKVIPGYAHAFLLSAVLSPDYSDVDNNGPSVNDLGNYVKFNYGNPYQTDALSGDNRFKWRTPLNANLANYNKGFISDKTDDRAFYNYGEKEIYYLHSIESKDRIAFFFLGKRRDGFEAADENGGVGVKTGSYLKQIKIYSREEFEKSGFGAIPLQTVNFEYSYDLCGNVPNFKASYTTGSGPAHPLAGTGNPAYAYAEAKKGKLTLHKVWFTFGKNPYPATSPYIFEYKGLNPDYGIRSVDRWGVFNNLLNPELPYSDQGVARSTFDQNASAWMLTDISLPSGGTVHFDYEADDYGYVQDKKVMQMIKIVSFEKNASYSGTPSNNIEDKNNPKEYLIFQKNKGGNASDYLSAEMLAYFTFRMNVSKP